MIGGSLHPGPVHIDPASALPTATWSAWSCGVRVVVGDPAALEPAVALVTRLMSRVDRAASRFLVESDLCWANANHGRPVVIPAVLIELIAGALDGARRSDGALDPTIGRSLARIGYDRDILLVGDGDGDGAGASAEPPVRAAGRPTWRDVRLVPTLGLLTVPRGAALDLGATAKAQTADWAARAVHARLGVDAMVEIGGDLAVAGPKRDWQIVVAERAGAPGQQISVARGGVATSTTTVRTWRRGGQRVHHIIDPRTARPAGGPWRTVSVAAGSALSANVCSTAAVVLGERAPAWLAAQGVAARLVDHAGAITRVGGWPIDAPSTGPAVLGTRV